MSDKSDLSDTSDKPDLCDSNFIMPHTRLREFQQLLFDCAARAAEPSCRSEAEVLYRKLLDFDPKVQELFCFQTERQFLDEKKAFIELNNSIVRREFSQRKAHSALLLLPFCIQVTSCPRRIVWKVENCRRCGACPVGELLRLANEKHVPVRVSVRGRFAPMFIRELKPEITLAVACEDELFLGMLRASKFRCFGVLNDRPEGYCINTTVETDAVREALDYFVPTHHGDTENITRQSRNQNKRQ